MTHDSMGMPDMPEPSVHDATHHADNQTPLVLGGDFPAADQAAWDRLVLGALNRGRPEGKHLTIDQAMSRLTTTTPDGVRIEPLYMRESTEGAILGLPGVAPFMRGATVRNGEANAWDICALHEDPDPKVTHEAVLEDLAKGVTSLWFRIDDDAVQAGDLPALLDGVLLDLAPVNVSSDAQPAVAADALLAALTARTHDAVQDVTAQTVAGQLNICPLTTAALNGTNPHEGPVGLNTLPDWIGKTEVFPQVGALCVRGDEFHNMGATPVQELAWTIASAIEYLRALDSHIPLDHPKATPLLYVAATTDQFMTMAKLRALRVLWSNVAKTVGIPADQRGAKTHAITSWREISRDDPYVNMLRATISVFGAATGMAEHITVLPFDTAHGLPTAFSRRMARNTQIILAEEANIGRVNDPAGGAYLVEDLTTQLATKAWELVQAIEAAGGMAAYLTSGALAQAITSSRDELAHLLATRAYPKTGVSMFPQVHDPQLERQPRPASVLPPAGAPAPTGGQAPIARARNTELFEALKDRTSAHPANVFMALLGERRDFGARETFTASVLAIGGVEGTTHEGGTPEEIAQAFTQAKTPVAILCSNTAVYQDQAIPVAQALKAAGATKVYLAGNLKECGDQDTSILDGTVALGMDVVAFVHTTLDEIGVPR